MKNCSLPSTVQPSHGNAAMSGPSAIGSKIKLMMAIRRAGAGEIWNTRASSGASR